MADKKIGKLSQKHKEALAMMASRPEFPAFLDFLRIQENNIGVFEWVRLHYTDPELKSKKAYWTGQLDWIQLLIQLFRDAQKEKEE
jgi:hypothetical protein